ncbi:PH domain-containing protein [Janibacter melonis]|uniref:PH domain-containing protein n=1 Tax=Janibacter melonis TaxID=262209 RepID=UPI00204435B0|nr:PH domain-containing protein [Janibacter melonis]MCM3555858.1 PH domain-containing protein [Janibacter melonis]
MEEVAHRGLRRYLLPGETPVAEIRHHAIVLLKPALAVVGATAVAGWLDVSTSDSGSRVLSFVWLVWLAVVLWALWQWVEWRHTRVVATDKRVVLFEGWINHKVSMMPLKKVTDMGYERSLVGRVLGYGTFILESAGQDQALSRIAFVPDPDENYRAICSVVFGVVPGEEDEAEGGDDRAWETTQDYATRLGVVDGRYVGTPPHPAPHHEPIYRSSDLVRRTRDDDTGELPPYDPDAY